MYTIATAAAAVGRAKTAIMRAIDAGKIPVAQTDNGDVQIDPADLYRVYPPLRSDGAKAQTKPQMNLSPLLIPAGK
jgi:hypothetical protein